MNIGFFQGIGLLIIGAAVGVVTNKEFRKEVRTYNDNLQRNIRDLNEHRAAENAASKN